MIVVSNTTPITNLARIGQLELLHSLYGEVHVPAAVWDELNRGPESQGRRVVCDATWIVTHSVARREPVAALRAELDAGESEAIALADELGCDLLLMDEAKGRRVAERLALKQTGAVGVLLEAKRRGLIAAVRPLLDDLRQKAGFWLSEEVYQRALELTLERPQTEAR